MFLRDDLNWCPSMTDLVVAEKALLADLRVKYGNVIECKATDGALKAVKAAAKRDSDPNVLQAGLQCQHYGKVEYSQGNLRIHLFRETNQGKPYAMLCGCCGSLFKFPELLANHLNQTGATARAPICDSPAGQPGHALCDNKFSHFSTSVMNSRQPPDH